LQLSPSNGVHQGYNTKHEDNYNAVISSWPIACTDVQWPEDAGASKAIPITEAVTENRHGNFTMVNQYITIDP